MPIIYIRISSTVTDDDGNVIRKIDPGESLAVKGPIVEGVLTGPDVQQEAHTSRDDRIMSQNGLVLLDTGASVTCFAIKAATNARLPTVGRGSMTSATHEDQPTPIFAGRLTFGGVNCPINHAMGANLMPQGLIALIGRDILRHGILIYNGADGSVTFAMP